MKSRPSTEHRSRTEDGRQLKLDVRQVLAAHRVIERELADVIDIDESLLSRRLKPDDKGAHLQLVDVARMPAEVQADVLRMLAARLGYDVVPVAQGMTATNGVMAAAAMLTVASDAAAETIRASSDGRLDRIEAVSLRAKHVAVREKANAIIGACDVAIKEGVAPLSANPSVS